MADTARSVEHILPFQGDRCMRCDARFYPEGGWRGVACPPKAPRGGEALSESAEFVETTREALRWYRGHVQTLNRIILRYRMDHAPWCASQMHGEGGVRDSRCQICVDVDSLTVDLGAPPGGWNDVEGAAVRK